MLSIQIDYLFDLYQNGNQNIIFSCDFPHLFLKWSEKKVVREVQIKPLSVPSLIKYGRLEKGSLNFVDIK